MTHESHDHSTTEKGGDRRKNSGRRRYDLFDFLEYRIERLETLERKIEHLKDDITRLATKMSIIGAISVAVFGSFVAFIVSKL